MITLTLTDDISLNHAINQNFSSLGSPIHIGVSDEVTKLAAINANFAGTSLYSTTVTNTDQITQLAQMNHNFGLM